jgi:hypothetical protein
MANKIDSFIDYASQLQNHEQRPEGPEVNRPDRKVGISELGWK